VERWPEAVAVALDAKNGKIALSGWRELASVGVVELAQTVKQWGVKRVQYTDVVRDGTFRGPNLEAAEQLARLSGLRITIAGGTSTLDDLARLAGLDPLGVDEVVVGKALYEGRFTLAEARGVLEGGGE
jgi:phosphoribosylformimino-5-aminoimidazole carboxamide ribotide isomerase